MDRQWPHQVAVPAYRCLGHNYLTIRFFCEGEGLSLCPRTQALRRDHQDMLIFSFAERAHAEHFLTRFGGDFLDTKHRAKWPGASSYHYAPGAPVSDQRGKCGEQPSASRYYNEPALNLFRRI
jgi:hypothetical protein